MMYFVYNKCTFRKKKLETCLNGKTSQKNLFFNFCTLKKNSIKLKQILYCFNTKNNEENSVPNRILPRKQPGLYMIRCIQNDWRYYGESSNVSGRLASHKSMLNRKIHPNKFLQNDWNIFGEKNFDFIILFMGPKWSIPYIRRGKETELIILNREFAYNILEEQSRSGEKNPFWKKLHTPETKKKISNALKGRSNDLLGRKISIKGINYPSIAEASRQTGIARKTIRKKIEDPENLDYLIDN